MSCVIMLIEEKGDSNMILYASINSLENLLTASPICNKFVEIES